MDAILLFRRLIVCDLPNDLDLNSSNNPLQINCNVLKVNLIASDLVNDVLYHEAIVLAIAHTERISHELAEKV